MAIRQIILPCINNISLASEDEIKALFKAEKQLDEYLLDGYEIVSSSAIPHGRFSSIHYTLWQDESDIDPDEIAPYKLKQGRLIDRVPTDEEIQDAIDAAVEAGYITKVSNGSEPTPNLSPLESFKQIVRTEDFFVLDTETTGLHDGEICQIALLHSSGQVLLDTYVKPMNPIPPDATKIHGITDEMVQDSPTWERVSDILRASLRVCDHLIVYNATFDRKMMHQSAEKAGLPKTEWKELIQWHCAMEMFVEIYGEWNSYHGNYKWQSLSKAASYYNIPVEDAHSALGDCKMTLAVVKAMAGDKVLAD